MKTLQWASFKLCFTLFSRPLLWAFAIVTGVVAQHVTLSAVLANVAVTFSDVIFTVPSYMIHNIGQ